MGSPGYLVGHPQEPNRFPRVHIADSALVSTHRRSVVPQGRQRTFSHSRLQEQARHNAKITLSCGGMGLTVALLGKADAVDDGGVVQLIREHRRVALKVSQRRRFESVHTVRLATQRLSKHSHTSDATSQPGLPSQVAAPVQVPNLRERGADGQVGGKSCRKQQPCFLPRHRLRLSCTCEEENDESQRGVSLSAL